MNNTLTNQQPQPIGCCILVFNPQGLLLVGKRKNSYKAGFYGVPGGRVELNENLHQTAQRELLEETKLQLPDLHYVGAVRENQGSYDFIHFVFVATGVTIEPQLAEPDKCEGWEWQEPSEALPQLLPGHAAGLKMYQAGQTIADMVEPS